MKWCFYSNYITDIVSAVMFKVWKINLSWEIFFFWLSVSLQSWWRDKSQTTILLKRGDMISTENLTPIESAFLAWKWCESKALGFAVTDQQSQTSPTWCIISYEPSPSLQSKTVLMNALLCMMLSRDRLNTVVMTSVGYIYMEIPHLSGAKQQI